MSKRSFQEFSTSPSGSSHYDSALIHADNLLKAAQSLKQDLERLGEKSGGSPSNEKILLTVKQHIAQIRPAANALSQDETASVRAESESRPKIQKVDQHQAASGLPIPHLALLTKWTPQDVPDSDVLPPLPPVLDPILERAARTHAGVARSLGEMDYERLEWIGDAYLYLISSAFIYQTFPNLSAGRCSQLRERLVKNETLSEFTLRYNLDKRARLPAEFQPGGRPSQTGARASASAKERKKILGDLLEAYVAAAILGDTDGLSRVLAWIRPVWGTVIRREIRDEYKGSVVREYSNSVGTQGQPVVERRPKVVLSQTIATKGVQISYQDIGQPKKDKNSGLPWFTVGAYYDGLGETNLSLGYGSGLSKQDAGNNAALKALENKKLIKRLRKLKNDMDSTIVKAAENPSDN
ncbi:ribonuclease III domain-containing protein [Xylaria venustula]|nr:ribonuclease III domain-containing protein [Xylaria venustula]